MSKNLSLTLLPKVILGDSRALIRAGDKFRDRKKWKRAAAAYRHVVRIDPQNAQIWMQLGHSLKEAGDLDGAGEAYLASVAINPDDADAHLQLGHYYKVSGRPKKAGEAYLDALKLSPILEDAYDELQQIGWSEAQIIKACPAIKRRNANAVAKNVSTSIGTDAFMRALREALSVGRRINTKFGK